MKISTWNLQGNGYNGMCSSVAEAKARMHNEEIDVFCLQETGFNENEQSEVLFSDNNFTLSRNLVVRTNRRGFKVNRYSFKFGKSNFRCSMAILVKAELDCNCPASIPALPNTNTRKIFGILVKNPKDKQLFAVYNIHSPSSDSAFTKRYFEYALSEIDKLVAQYNISNVVLVGDFNNPPYVTSEGLKTINTHLKYRIFAPYKNTYYIPTHNSGNCLDYCCATLQPQSIDVSTNAAFSDHLQVTFNF